MLFYFTGTGNSLYVAKQLDKNPISIPQVIHNETLCFQDKKIGIVCPIFGHEMPNMVKEFLNKATFSAEYFYIILTYGRRHGGAAELANELVKDLGIKANYINTIIMVDNFLPSFDMNEEKALDKKVNEQIKKVKKDIEDRKCKIQTATQEDRKAHAEFIERSAKMPKDAFINLFKITEKCIGCGICTKVCPAGCYHIEKGKAVQCSDGCQTCMACIHNCPQNAIALTMPEKNPNARYRNEHIKLQEIILANNQNR